MVLFEKCYTFVIQLCGKYQNMDLIQHIATLSLPRLIITNSKLDDVNYVDIGLLLSKSIESFLNSKRLSLEANDIIEKIIKENISFDKRIGEYIAMCNIGILFEPALHLDLHAKFMTWSKICTLIIDASEGIMLDKTFYLSNNSKKDYSINLLDIPFDTI